MPRRGLPIRDPKSRCHHQHVERNVYPQRLHAESARQHVIYPHAEYRHHQLRQQPSAPRPLPVLVFPRQDERRRQRRPEEQLQMLPDALVHRRKQPHQRRGAHIIQKMQPRPRQNRDPKRQPKPLFHKQTLPSYTMTGGFSDIRFVRRLLEELVVDDPHRPVGIRLVDQHRQLDLARRDHVDVDVLLIERLKRLGRHARIAEHARAHD